MERHVCFRSSRRGRPEAGLKILVLLHPLGPVAGRDAAAAGPAVLGVERGMPLQGPDLLEASAPRMAIEKQHVDGPVVPVHAVEFHVLPEPGGFDMVKKQRWRVTV